MAIEKISISDLQELSFEFALNTLKFCKELKAEGEDILADQLLKSVTQVGMIANSIDENSHYKELIQAAQAAKKPLRASLYWLDLLEKGKVVEAERMKALRQPLDKIKNTFEGKAKSAQAKTRVGF